MSEAEEQFKATGSTNYKRILKLLAGESVNLPMESGKKKSKIFELKNAATEGCLSQFFDVQDVPHPLISEFLSTPVGVASLSNILQALWFGANIENVNRH